MNGNLKRDLERLATLWEGYSAEYKITADDTKETEPTRAIAQRSQHTWAEAAKELRKLLAKYPA